MEKTSDFIFLSIFRLLKYENFWFLRYQAQRGLNRREIFWRILWSHFFSKILSQSRGQFLNLKLQGWNYIQKTPNFLPSSVVKIFFQNFEPITWSYFKFKVTRSKVYSKDVKFCAEFGNHIFSEFRANHVTKF